jgi:flagellin
MGLANIRTNLAALKSFNSLTDINKALNLHQERISTGKKVNRASDSPAGYYITKVYERQIRQIDRNLVHVENATNQLQTTDSDMAQIVKLLTDTEDLVNQAKSGLVTTEQKNALKLEIDELVGEIKSIVTGLKNLSGISVGANLTVNVDSTSVMGSDLGIMTGTTVQIKVDTATNVDISLGILSGAIESMLTREEKIGAYVSRLTAKGDAYAVNKINKKAQKSVIEDSDLAEETLDLTKYQILQQSALAMLAQTNVAPQSLLQLLQA